MDIHHRDESESIMAAKLPALVIEGSSRTYVSFLKFDNISK